MNIRKYLACFLLQAGCLIAVGCGSVPPIDRLDSGSVIVAFGDSLTFGTGAPREASYPAVLEQLIGRQVVNAGVSGELSADGAARLPEVLDEHRPDVLILCHGGNDLLRKQGEEQLADNLRRMIREARSRGTDVVLIGVPQPSLLLSTADLYDDLADEFDVPYEDDLLTDIVSTAGLKSDPIHPNADGYRELAEGIRDLLVAAEAI